MDRSDELELIEDRILKEMCKYDDWYVYMM